MRRALTAVAVGASSVPLTLSGGAPQEVVAVAPSSDVTAAKRFVHTTSAALGVPPAAPAPASGAKAAEEPKDAAPKKKKVVDFSQGAVHCIDGNQAAAYVSYAVCDAAFVYPITPSSPMAEQVDEWAANGLRNCFGQTMQVTEMQSEGGAAGALHGCLTAGGLGTTYTSSQGLLLMIPNMFKIAGELLPCVMHVSSRTVATHSLSIYGDHSDVIAVKQTGWSIICSENAQVAHDLAIVAHCATLDTRVPIIHFFEGFRTSHEVSKVKLLGYDQIRELLPEDKVNEHRARGLHPNRPTMEGSAHDSEDAFFQAAEASNVFYDAVPAKLEYWLDKVGKVTGRKYDFFEYEGHPEAEQIVIVMGSAGMTVSEYVKQFPDRKIGMIKVRVFRPWSAEHLIKVIPESVKRISVLDRVRDPTAGGEPMLSYVASSLQRARGRFSQIEIVGGRYGVSGKNFTPAHVHAVYNDLASPRPRDGFVVGVIDDVTFRSLPNVPFHDILPAGTRQCIFYGLGSDGTVGANKAAVKMIGEVTDNYTQGYFQYDSKKTGGRTISHLRFGPKPILAPYVVMHADYIACHYGKFVDEMPWMLDKLKTGGTVVVNTNVTAEEVEARFPAEFLRTLAEKKAKLYVIDALKLCQKIGLGRRINMVMQSVFFYLSKVIPYEEAERMLKGDIQKLFGLKGDHIVKMNLRAVDEGLTSLREVPVLDRWLKKEELPQEKKLHGGERSADRQKYIDDLLRPMSTMRGDSVPVSKFAPGGSMPTGTSFAEKRGIATDVPVVDMDKCTQCNYCSLVCPHAAIRPFLMTADELLRATPAIKSSAKPAIGGGALDNFYYRVQVSPLDCTGCELCAQVCPSKAISMRTLDAAIKDGEAKNWEFAVELPNHGKQMDKTTVKGSQFHKPLLEFSGACGGCGETAYVKLLTQLMGDRLVLANATGCSRIWGSAVSSAYTVQDGRGPAYGNSLFEDNAEYGFGMLRAQAHQVEHLVQQVDLALADPTCKMSEPLRKHLEQFSSLRRSKKRDMMLIQGKSSYQALAEKIVPLLEQEKDSHRLLQKVWLGRDYFMRISVWSIGGDGWAYDIGFGGLDHVLASGDDVKVLVLDTEAYSNTGGQVSKSSGFGVSQKMAGAGKASGKKDLGQYAISTYRNVYVASICLEANHQQALRAILEAEAYPGPAVVIAYCPCISHGYGLKDSIQHCRDSVASGYWPLYRYNPTLATEGNNPFQLDSKKVTGDVLKLIASEGRFVATARRDPDLARALDAKLKEHVDHRTRQLHFLAQYSSTSVSGNAEASGTVVLYGSETGNAEELAKTLVGDLAARGMGGVTLSSCDDFDFSELPSIKHLIVVISTCGLGEFPQNSRKFWAALSNPDLPMNYLSNVKFSVFGLGDSTYSQFCYTAEHVDVRLGELGATRLAPRGVGDDCDEDRYYTGWESWQPRCFDTLEVPRTPLERKAPPASYTVEVTRGGSAPATDEKALVPEGAIPCKLLENTLLTPEGYDRDIRHYEFSLEGTPIRYQCGDSLAVFPKNDAAKVAAFCKMYGVNPTDELSIVPKADARNKLPHELSVEQLFRVYLNLFGKPSKKFFEHLLNFSTDAQERAKLELIIADTEEGHKAHREFVSNYATYADVLAAFPKSHPPLEHLMNIVPLIRPRSYSISSSPLMMEQKKLQLTVVKVDWTVPATKEYREGLCTSYLLKRQAGEQLNVALRKSAIVVPEDLKRPVIMAGMGTGIAPWRAMVQHRAAQKAAGADVGPCVMFFGARSSKGEYLYEEEFGKYSAAGLLQMHTAFSRDQKEKIYVQHRVVEQGEALFNYIVNEKAYFYVCGTSRNVPEDIYNAVKSVLMKHGKLEAADAEAYLVNMRQEGRYIVEAWA